MRISKQYLIFLATGLFAISMTATAYAQELDVTMEVVDDNGTEEVIVNRLELPEDASDQGRESSRYGLDTANEARERGREFGQSRASEARERGEEARERGQAARDAARDRAANAGDREQNPLN
ncbi:MAG: hypothetical protein WED00_13915 [Aquisalimonadaceae bacterium]